MQNIHHRPFTAGSEKLYMSPLCLKSLAPLVQKFVCECKLNRFSNQISFNQNRTESNWIPQGDS